MTCASLRGVIDCYDLEICVAFAVSIDALRGLRTYHAPSPTPPEYPAHKFIHDDAIDLCAFGRWGTQVLEPACGEFFRVDIALN